MDELDGAIVNGLQDGIAIAERPFAAPAARLGTSEAEVIARLERLLSEGVLSRFGPMYDAEKLGGALCLCAMTVPAEHFERVAEQVNGFSEVAHNYEREHALNMWFVLATETPGQIDRTIAAIEQRTGLSVLRLPKLEEYYVGLKLEVQSLEETT